MLSKNQTIYNVISGNNKVFNEQENKIEPYLINKHKHYNDFISTILFYLRILYYTEWLISKKHQLGEIKYLYKNSQCKLLIRHIPVVLESKTKYFFGLTDIF